ncbi:MFS transporter [Nocardiopsis changdeensis]|uniref:MFS transporter n=1 Tax=Nocardiopsis changdeensis TaxID=2831969 RepID=A0ABX8BQU0_9ACTN|nr:MULTISPECIES: MFS transporter [Nocardiopsis]QUX24100.1 MFS transporter [Nocardiopsis changdeensis]QYX34496.1 MFS transporter [Nocardiopsis sp. MT53]
MSRVYLLALVELASLGPLATALAVSLSLKVLEIAPESKEASLALVTTAGAVAALVSNPVWGHLSDRTRSRFGRRRPWIVSGAVLGAVSAVLMLLAPGVGWLAAAWALGQAGYNASLAALNAMLADQVPEEQRAKASGVFGAFGFLGLVPAMLIAAVFAENLAVVMLAMPLISLVIVGVVCAVVPDAPVSGAGARERGIGDVFRAFLFNPLRVPRFSLVWVQRCVMQFGYTIVGTFGLFYLIERLGMEQGEAVSLTSLATVAGAGLNTAAAFACGYLASRRGNYGPFIVAATAAMAVSLLMKAYTGDVSVFWASTVVAGFALGVYYSIDLALVMRTLPAGEEGKFLGIFNLAKTIPQSVAPALAPLALAVGGPDPVTGHENNYASLYLAGAVAVLLSLAVLPGLRPVLRRAPATPETSAVPETPAVPEALVPPAASVASPAPSNPPGAARSEGAPVSTDSEDTTP